MPNLVWIHLQLPAPVVRWLLSEAAKRKVGLERLVEALLIEGFRRTRPSRHRSGTGPSPSQKQTAR